MVRPLDTFQSPFDSHGHIYWFSYVKAPEVLTHGLNIPMNQWKCIVGVKNFMKWMLKTILLHPYKVGQHLDAC